MTVTIMGNIFYHLNGKGSGSYLAPFKNFSLNYLSTCGMWELCCLR